MVTLNLVGSYCKISAEESSGVTPTAIWRSKAETIKPVRGAV
jgi:hypothetical protein